MGAPPWTAPFTALQRRPVPPTPSSSSRAASQRCNRSLARPTNRLEHASPACLYTRMRRKRRAPQRTAPFTALQRRPILPAPSLSRGDAGQQCHRSLVHQTNPLEHAMPACIYTRMRRKRRAPAPDAPADRREARDSGFLHRRPPHAFILDARASDHIDRDAGRCSKAIPARFSPVLP